MKFNVLVNENSLLQLLPLTETDRFRGHLEMVKFCIQTNSSKEVKTVFTGSTRSRGSSYHICIVARCGRRTSQGFSVLVCSYVLYI